MGVTAIFLFMVALLVAFVYVKFPPAFANKKLVGTFDMMVLGVCVFLCLGWALRTYVKMGVGPGSADIWKPMALIGALGIEIVFLSICFVARNFWVFKPPRAGGRGFFR